MEKKRFTLLDILRGLSLLSMIIYHTIWDLVFIYGVNISWYHTTNAYIWQQSICWTFILLSGFCWSFGHHKLKRGLTVLAASAMISTVTIVFMPDSAVKFGILGLIATGMMLLIPFDRFLKRLRPFMGMILSFGLFFLTKNVPFGFLGFEGTDLADIPNGLYRNTFTAYIGFPPADFISSDYFPVIPWIFLYFTGYFIYQAFKKHGILRHLSCISIKPLEWLGRHSLIIYMLHQPVIYGVLYVVFVLIERIN